MLIRNPKAFTRGALLMISFVAVFIAFFMPLFPGQEEGAGKSNGLVYADHLFNTLSKGSTAKYLIADVEPKEFIQTRVDAIKKADFDVVVPLKNAAAIPAIADLAQKVGMSAEPKDHALAVKGDLKVLLSAMIKDSISMYHNNAEEVAARYGVSDGKAVMKSWHELAKNMIKPLQKVGMVAEASTVNTVLTKGIELGFNFYNITPIKVSDNIPLVAGFLIFYVVYTMWYGFAIFELFEGIGLTMKKSVKQEV